jgi:hypothetical protein
VIVLLVLFVPAALMAYVLHNPAWLVAVPVVIFGLIMALAFVFGTLERLFGFGRRKATPEEFANALEKHLLREEPDPGWDDPMDVVLADPRLEQVRRRLGPNLDSLSREETKTSCEPSLPLYEVVNSPKSRRSAAFQIFFASGGNIESSSTRLKSVYQKLPTINWHVS